MNRVQWSEFSSRWWNALLTSAPGEGPGIREIVVAASIELRSSVLDRPVQSHLAVNPYHSPMFETRTFRVGMDPAVRMYQRARTEPGWVSKTAAVAAFLVLVLPLLFLGLLALITGIVVFTVLALVNKAWSAFTGRSLFTAPAVRRDPSDDLRENVRVIGRD